jgi:hypothetical protein
MHGVRNSNLGHRSDQLYKAEYFLLFASVDGEA